jgi:hypothetical protein
MRVPVGRRDANPFRDAIKCVTAFGSPWLIGHGLTKALHGLSYIRFRTSAKPKSLEKHAGYLASMPPTSIRVAIPEKSDAESTSGTATPRKLRGQLIDLRSQARLVFAAAELSQRVFKDFGRTVPEQMQDSIASSISRSSIWAAPGNTQSRTGSSTTRTFAIRTTPRFSIRFSAPSI